MSFTQPHLQRIERLDSSYLFSFLSSHFRNECERILNSLEKSCKIPNSFQCWYCYTRVRETDPMRWSKRKAKKMMKRFSLFSQSLYDNPAEWVVHNQYFSLKCSRFSHRSHPRRPKEKKSERAKPKEIGGEVKNEKNELKDRFHVSSHPQ